jgi:hypothetical protein
VLTDGGHGMTSADRQCVMSRVVRALKDYKMPGDDFTQARDKYRLAVVMHQALCTPSINQTFFTRRPEDHAKI